MKKKWVIMFALMAIVAVIGLCWPESDGLCLGAAAGRLRSHVAAGEPLHRPDGEQADQNGQHIRRGLRKIDAGDAEQGRQREDERHIEQPLTDERQKQAVARCARKNRSLAEK